MTDPHSPTPTTSLLDTSSLDELLDMFGDDGPDIVGDIVETYLVESPDLVARIDEAVIGRNLPAIRDAAHSLKSASGNVGAVGLANLCQCVETAAANGDEATALTLSPDVAAMFTETSLALRHWRNALG